MPQCSQTILLKLVKMVNFMLCKLYHNKKKSLKKVTLDLSSKLLTPCPNSTLAILANQQSNYPSLISFPHPSLQSNRKSINSNSRTYPNFVHPSSSLSSLQAYSHLRTTWLAGPSCYTTFLFQDPSSEWSFLITFKSNHSVLVFFRVLITF